MNFSTSVTFNQELQYPHEVHNFYPSTIDRNPRQTVGDLTKDVQRDGVRAGLLT